MRYIIETNTPFDSDTIIKSESLYYAETGEPNPGSGMQCAVSEEKSPTIYAYIESMCRNIASTFTEVERFNVNKEVQEILNQEK